MKKTKAQIEALLHENAGCFKIAKVLKNEIKTYFETLEESFSTSGGKDFLVKHTKKIDAILELSYKVVLREMFKEYLPMKNSIPIALVALGSYGREQLCVHSDIDLMIVYKDIGGFNNKEIIEKLLYLLWDMGLKLGHRVHTVEELFEVSKTDITIKTALIESRFIEGSHFIWMETQNAIEQIRHDDIPSFISLKIEEQRQKHLKYPLTMEPNIKEGVGGFRNANLVFWIGKVLYNTDNIKSLPSHIVSENEYKIFRVALEFLFRVRSALHLATHKKEDRLRLDLIPKVSQLLGYEQNKENHLKFAKKVTESLKVIRLYSKIWIDLLTKKCVKRVDNENYLIPLNSSKNFNDLLDELCVGAKNFFIPHPSFLQALANAPKEETLTARLYQSILEIFYQPHAYSVLYTLSCARVLHYTIEPIKKVVDLPQFDGYHQYPVDTHSIECIYHIENIQDSFIKSLFQSLSKEEQAMLKIVTFLHDAGKGRKTDHHQVGTLLFKNFALKLGLSLRLIAMGETLILYHTLMSNVAQREDLYSQKVILGFASHFATQKLLDMIYVLTYADMNGVGNDIYNSFTAKLIKTLYKQSIEVLGQTSMLDEASKRSKKELLLKKYPDFVALKKSEQKKILQMPSNLLFLRYKPQRILAICKKAFETQTYTYHISNTEYLTIELIRKDSFNLSYLLSKLHNLEVVNMDICQLFDEKKYFKIDFSSNVSNDEIGLVEALLEKSFDGKSKKVPLIPSIKSCDIEVDCDHSKSYALMHLKSQNQKGLLAFVIDMFDEMDIEIVTAKVHTLKNHVRDMFLIEKNGNFCHNVDMIVEKLTTQKEKG